MSTFQFNHKEGGGGEYCNHACFSVCLVIFGGGGGIFSHTVESNRCLVFFKNNPDPKSRIGVVTFGKILLQTEIKNLEVIFITTHRRVFISSQFLYVFPIYYKHGVYSLTV